MRQHPRLDSHSTVFSSLSSVLGHTRAFECLLELTGRAFQGHQFHQRHNAAYLDQLHDPVFSIFIKAPSPLTSHSTTRSHHVFSGREQNPSPAPLRDPSTRGAYVPSIRLRDRMGSCRLDLGGAPAILGRSCGNGVLLFLCLEQVMEASLFNQNFFRSIP